MNYEELTCDICTNYFTIPTFKCSNSHSVCVACFEMLTCCPFCRVQYDDPPERDTKIEEQLADPLLPCKNSHLGCEVKTKRQPMRQHELKCPYGSIKCPTYSTNCTEIVQLRHLGQHLADKHNCTVKKFNRAGEGLMEIRDFHAKNSSEEFFFEGVDGRKLFVSFLFYNYNRGMKNVSMFPLEVQSDSLSGFSNHSIIVHLREHSPQKKHTFVLPFRYYENRHKYLWPKRNFFLFNNVKKSNEPKSFRLTFYVVPNEN